MSSKDIYHMHHIVPRHAGGTNDPSNLVRLTIEEHAKAHKLLYEQYGKWQDKIAWKMLSGQITSAEARVQAARLRDTSYMQTKAYKEKMSKSKKGSTPWNKGKKSVQDFDTISGKNHYKAASCRFKDKTYNTIKEAVDDTGISKYFLEKHPDFNRM